jgi:chemotaxis protein MotB
MARKKTPPEPENHERWLVSYADFITLLFAFFVVMYASSQTDKVKAKQVADAVREALQEGQVKAVLASILGGAPDDKGRGSAAIKGPRGLHVELPKTGPPKAPAGLGPSEKQLRDDLKLEIAAGKIKIVMEPRGLVVSLQEAAFFSSGDDTVTSKAWGSIEKIARAVNKIANPVRLEGHTDSVPIHNSRFRSNWNLSAARAVAVLDMLSGRYGTPAARLAVAGYADTAPVETNETEAGRARNRRVDVVILAPEGMRPEPQGHSRDTKDADKKAGND